MGYYWPNIFKDAKKYARSCDHCQRMDQPGKTNEMLLQTQLVIEPFERGVLYFVGQINPPSSHKAYIFVCIYYVTKWVEAKALSRATK